MLAPAGGEIADIDQPSNFLDFGAVDRPTPADGLESIEFARIVAAGDHHSAVGLEVHGGIIQQRGGDHAYVRNVAARSKQTCEQSVTEPRRAEPAVAPQVNARPTLALK